MYPLGRVTGHLGSDYSKKVTRMFSEEIEEMDFAGGQVMDSKGQRGDIWGMVSLSVGFSHRSSVSVWSYVKCSA